MTTASKDGQVDTDPTSNTNNITCNIVNATEIPATIPLTALETLLAANYNLLAANYNPITTKQLANNSNITLDADLARVPSMPDDPAISAVLAPFLNDLVQSGPDVATSVAVTATSSKKVFKANKTGEKYTEIDILSEGVYKVLDRLGDLYVVKAPKETASVTKIKQEIAHLEKLRGHCNVLQYFGVVHDSDGMYLRQELCLPRNLSWLMAKRKFLTEPEVRYFGKQIVEGVRAIHRNGIIHRDLNPGNILVGEGMILKISSFGSSISKSEKFTGFIGSVGFVAPEVVKKEEHTTGMDVFSVGIMIYMMFNCKKPCITDEHGVHPPPGNFYKKIRGSKEARGFVKWALKIDPKERALIMDLAFHDFLKDDSFPKTLPESVFDTAPVLGDITSSNDGDNFSKRKAGDQDGDDGGQDPVDLNGDQQQASATVMIVSTNKRRRLDDFSEVEQTRWEVKDFKSRKRELKEWRKMMNARMQAEADRMQAEADRLRAKYGAHIDLDISTDADLKL